MTGLQHFARDNWYSLLLSALIAAGAIHQLGFKARDMDALREFTRETRAVQVKKVSEFEGVRADVERLKWELAERKTAFDEMKLDVRDTRRAVQELEKRTEVIIQLLRPVGGAGRASTTPLP